MQRKPSLAIVLAALLASALFGCSSLFGPSDDDVQKAVGAALNGFAAVPFFQASDADQLRYSNSAELYNANADETITQEASLVIDRAGRRMTCEGVCRFDGYVDATSGHTLTGRIDYQMAGRFDGGGDDFSMTYAFDLQYADGAVKSIAFTIDENSDHLDNRPELLVNGSAYRFRDEVMRDYVGMLRSMKVM